MLYAAIQSSLLRKAIPMKRSLLLSSILSASLIGTVNTNAHADMDTETKKGIVGTTAIIGGALLAGPAGILIGVAGGSFVNNQIDEAEAGQQAQLTLQQQTQRIAQLEQALVNSQRRTTEMKKLAFNNLKFQVLFHTGQDTLTQQGKERIDALADFLQSNPDMIVRLDGHTDPRGSDDYNQVLSSHRALAVEESLQQAGIESQRIERRAHGASYSKANRGDLEAYAMERRVNIEVFQSLPNESVASNP